MLDEVNKQSSSGQQGTGANEALVQPSSQPTTNILQIKSAAKPTSSVLKKKSDNLGKGHLWYQQIIIIIEESKKLDENEKKMSVFVHSRTTLSPMP